MPINWTPWFNVPFHRRLEVFCAGFTLFLVVGFPAVAVPAIIYIFLSVGHIWMKTLCVLYLAFVYYDRDTGDRGGRGAGVAWIRNLSIWKYCIDYFPLDLVKTVDLPADQNYLICCFPHGVISLGIGATFLSARSKWSQLFPGIRSKLSTLNALTVIPVSREINLSLGNCSASENSLITLMNQSNDPTHETNRDGYTSNAVALMVGGAQEAFYAFPNTYKCVLRKRRGFIKIGLKTGATLVPAISFGETSLYGVVDHKPGSWGRWLQDKFKQWTKFAPVQFYGRGFFQYDFGVIPRRFPITIVMGAPIQLDKNPNPTTQDIEKIHKLFCDKLIDLFETHKSKYVANSEEVQLEII